MEEFMDGIADMVTDLVQTYHSISNEQKSMFGGNRNGQEALGKCLKCGGDVVKGKYGAFKREIKMYCYCAHELV